MPLRLEIVTPAAKTFSEDVDMVTMPGADGELGILPMHAPLMTQLKPGSLRVLRGGQETLLAIGEGFAEVLPDRVSVLTDMAVAESDIDESEVQKALERAEAARNDKSLGDEEAAAVEAAIANSLAQLNLKRRRRNL